MNESGPNFNSSEPVNSALLIGTPVERSESEIVSADVGSEVSSNPIAPNTQPSIAVAEIHCHRPKPILIPPPTTLAHEIRRITTPLTGRPSSFGIREGHLFPFSRTPSPRIVTPASPGNGKARTSSHSSDEGFFGQLERVRSASPGRSVRSGRPSMHNEPVNMNRYPTSPLSPKPMSKQTLSPQNSQRRGNHGRQVSRNMQLNLGRYHPSNFLQGDAIAEGLAPPAITYPTAPMTSESPRLMRQRQREFIEKARLTSKLAASPMSSKPDAPRLDPLGSPKGPVTPLELEADDYFSTMGAGKTSPATSPAARSSRSRSGSREESSRRTLTVGS